MTEFSSEEETLGEPPVEVMFYLNKSSKEIQDIYDQTSVFMSRVGYVLPTDGSKDVVFITESSNGDVFPFLSLDRDACRLFLHPVPELYRSITNNCYIRVINPHDEDEYLKPKHNNIRLVEGIYGNYSKQIDTVEKVLLVIRQDSEGGITVMTQGYKSYTLFQIRRGFILDLKTGMSGGKFDTDYEGRLCYEEL